MSHGRHRKPTHKLRTATRLSIGGASLVAVSGAAIMPAHADPGDLSAALDAIAQCESGGNATAQNPRSSASGLYQIIDGTWAAYGGVKLTGFVHARQASPADQLTIARRIAEDGLQAWNASRSCWEDVVDAPPAVQSTPEPAPVVEPVPVPAPVEETPVQAAPVEDIFPTEEIPVVTEADSAITGETVTVQDGDTLSGIAPQVDLASWETLYEVNVATIGPDPNLILPGQLLQLPTGAVYHGGEGKHRAPDDDVVVEQTELPPVPQATPQAETQEQAQVEVDEQAQVTAAAVAPLASMTITSGFQTSSRPGHDGIDLRAPLDTPFVAMMGGTVLEEEPATNAGWWILVAQDDGTIAAYMHLYGNHIYVRAGERIETGQHIGDTGDNGAPGQPHLHIGIKVGTTAGDWNSGKVINPVTWLANNGVTM